MQEISITDKIETFPVVASSTRWPCLREERGPEPYFKMFPDSRNDPRRNQFGAVAAKPPPFARGGGLFPVLTLMADGRLCCATRTGASHAGSGGSEISVSFSDDRGQSWSDYSVVVSGDPDRGMDPRNPSLAQAADGALVMTYGTLIGNNPRADSGNDARGERAPAGAEHTLTWMEVIRSSDDGKTWTEPNRISSPEDALLTPHGQMRRLDSGDLIFNARGSYSIKAYKRNPDLPIRVSYLFRSADGGDTWELYSTIGAGSSETGFVALDDDHWVGYVRHNDRANRIAHSHDAGKTWKKWVETAVTGEGASTASPEDALGSGDWRMVNSRVQKPSPGSVVRLPDGKVLITYGYRAYPFGVRAIVSRDGGHTFDTDREYVLSDSAFCWDVGYPSTVCFDDGTIVTTAYSIMDLGHPEWGTCCLAYRYHQDAFS